MNGIDSQGRGQTAADAPAAYPPYVKAADLPTGRVGRISAAHPATPAAACPRYGETADAPAAYPPYVRAADLPVGRVGRISAAHPAKPSSAPAHQSGAVLVVALIFLLLLSIVAVSIMRSGQLEVLMAGNSQGQLSAFEWAEGISESILARWANNLNPSDVVCTTGFPAPSPSDTALACTVTTLAMDNRLNPATSSIGPIKTATVQGRVRPLNNGKPSCVPAFITGIAHGTWAFFFDVEAGYDNSTSRQGASRVNHGAVLVNPVSSDCFANPPIGNLDKYANIPTS